MATSAERYCYGEHNNDRKGHNFFSKTDYMGEKIVTLQDIYSAYRKLKNYYYYDNSNLFIRQQIAEFEEGLDLRKNKKTIKDKIATLFEPVVDLLNHLWNLCADEENIGDSLRQSEEFNGELNKISCFVIPKEITKREKTYNYHYITNKVSNETVELANCNYMIEAPILIHLISILWIERVGVKIHSAIGKSNYAYKLNVTKDEAEQRVSIKEGLMLFHPYFIGYQEWRDNALDEAKRLLDQKKDVTILSLDIKRYYYSVRINVPLLIENYLALTDEKIPQDVKFFNELLQLVHEQYQKIVEPYLDDKTTEENAERHETILPVGLLSSGLIANFYLTKFDKYVTQKVAPTYYGRYVDDMIFVFQNRQVDDSDGLLNPVDKFLKENFCQVHALLEDNDDNEDGKIYYINDKGDDSYKKTSNLRIQSKKVILEHFDHRCSHAAIDIFMHNLTKKRSEYRFLPDEEGITAEFDHEAYQLLYDDSVNKIRSIKDFKEDKYGAAKYLAKQIYLSKLADTQSTNESKVQKEKVAHQLLTFFTGPTAITMFSLWERVATYFILNDDLGSLVKFYYNIVRLVAKVEIRDGKPEEVDEVKKSLRKHLLFSLAMPVALAPKKIYEYLKGKIRNAKDLLDASVAFRHSNLFRANNIGLMGINLTDALLDDSIVLNSGKLSDFSKLDRNEGICWLSSRYIHFEELNMLAIYKTIGDNKNCNKYYDKIEESYIKYSRNWMSLFSPSENIPQNDHSMVEVRDGNYISLHDYTLTTSKTYPVDKKIAIVNKKVNEDHFMNVVKYQNALHTLYRRQELVKIINDCIEQGCHMLVMPEMTVPFAWVSFLVERAKRSDIAIITGLEYCVFTKGKDKRIVNFVATILPMKEKYLSSSFVHLREKNFYSPKEELLLDGYRYDFPKLVKEPQYTLFHWRKSYFSVYNCFELADLRSRARFMSKVDFIVAVEYNRDIHYFSDVVGAWARDIHCFIVQVNSSDFGDSKVIMPSKTDEKTLVQVKGGDNTVVLVCTLPIQSLRDFQLATYVVQQNDKRFKFTPPSFDHNLALKRHNDEELDGKHK